MIRRNGMGTEAKRINRCLHLIVLSCNVVIFFKTHLSQCSVTIHLHLQLSPDLFSFSKNPFHHLPLSLSPYFSDPVSTEVTQFACAPHAEASTNARYVWQRFPEGKLRSLRIYEAAMSYLGYTQISSPHLL